MPMRFGSTPPFSRTAANQTNGALGILTGMDLQRIRGIGFGRAWKAVFADESGDAQVVPVARWLDPFQN